MIFSYLALRAACILGFVPRMLVVVLKEDQRRRKINFIYNDKKEQVSKTQQ